MKTLYTLFFILIFFCLSIHAQDVVKPPAYQVGITGLPILAFDNSMDGLNGLNGVALYGNIGRFIKEKNVVGLRPFFGVVDVGVNDNQRLHSAGVNVYYRRYLTRSRWSFFVDANAGFGHIWYSSPIPSLDQFYQRLNGVLFNFAFGPGVDFEMAKGWNIELTLQYLQMRNIDHPTETSVGRNLIPSIGIQKFF